MLQNVTKLVALLAKCYGIQKQRNRILRNDLQTYLGTYLS